MSNPGPAVTSTPLTIRENVPQSDGNQFGQTALELIGFWGATPIAQPSPAANVHTVAAGSVTAVFVNTSFDGSVGATAYTIGDIVAVLKAAGLLKS